MILFCTLLLLLRVLETPRLFNDAAAVSILLTGFLNAFAVAYNQAVFKTQHRRVTHLQNASRQTVIPARQA